VKIRFKLGKDKLAVEKLSVDSEKTNSLLFVYVSFLTHIYI
jgi:hypothetical protein